jgi:hypothetical protein
VKGGYHEEEIGRGHRKISLSSGGEGGILVYATGDQLPSPLTR